MRGATFEEFDQYDGPEISIHAPREGSDRGGGGGSQRPVQISIHAPREGSDLVRSTRRRVGIISIHAPREGSDKMQKPRLQAGIYFYPRSP